MKRSFLAGVVLAAGMLCAHEIHGGKAVSITGTVVDTGCYLSAGAMGANHVACATACAKKGIPLAIVDASGKLYLPIATEHVNQNPKLMPFVEKKVKVTGTLVEKGGMNGLAIETIAPAQ